MNINEIRNQPPQLSILTKAQKPAPDALFENQLQNASAASSKAEATQSPLHTKEQPAALTNSEKDYFEQLFPNSADEIRSYNPYQRDGATTAVRLGTHVDRKG